MLLQVLSFLTQVGVGIWLVPYLVHHLGRAAYGLIPIAGALTQYVALINHSISSAVTRFLTIALQRNDVDDANRVFNTAFFSYFAIGLIQIPIFALLIWNANAIFSIPQELYRDAIVLLTCSAAAFLINLVCSVFAVPLYANNRLDMSRGIDIARLILRLTGIVFLFLWFGPRLRYVGYVDLTLSVALAFTKIVIARRLSPMLTMKLRFFDWSKVRQLTSMGGWLLVNQVGVLLFLRTDVWVCNRFVGAEAAGDYAAILQWPTLIRAGAAILSGLVTPMIMIYYARSEIQNIVKLSKLSIRLFSIMLAIPVSVICVFSAPLLRFWLGDSFAKLSPLMVIMVCHLVINVSTSPLFSAKTALNRVKWPGVANLVGGVMSLVFAILFTKYTGWGVYGIAIASGMVLTIKNGLFMPIYSAFILGQPWHTFLKSYLFGLSVLIGLLPMELIVRRYVDLASLSELAIVMLTMLVIGIVFAWLLLPNENRRVICSLKHTLIR